MNFQTMQEAYDNRHPAEEDEERYTYEEALELAQDEFLKSPEILLEFLADLTDTVNGKVGRVLDGVSDDDSNAHLLAVILNGFHKDVISARSILRERILATYADEIKEAARDMVGELKE